MVIQYFRWRCKLLDDRTIQDEFSKDGWKWWNMGDGCYDLYGEMIQLPRWMCYDQQLTVVKQKCKEFVKVTIQWNCLGLFSRKFKVFIFNFLFDVLFFFAHSCIFVSPFPDNQPQKKREDGDEPTNQPIDIMVNQYFRWRCELLDNRPIQ
jgi:hypothetical protein